VAAQLQQMQGQTADVQKQLTEAKDATARLEDQRKQLEQVIADAQAKQQAATAAAEQAEQQQDTAATRHYSISQVSWDRHSRSVGRRLRHPER
jgi:phage shock protein A